MRHAGRFRKAGHPLRGLAVLIPFMVAVSMAVTACGGGRSAAPEPTDWTVVRVTAATQIPESTDPSTPGSATPPDPQPVTTAVGTPTAPVPSTLAQTDPTEAPRAAADDTTTTVSTTTPPATTTPTTRDSAGREPKATQPAAEPPPSTAGLMSRGDSGDDVRALQERLVSLGFWLGEINGRFGSNTEHAVVAFQKTAGITRDGVVGPDTRQALERGVRAQARSTTGRVVEIDLERQILLLVRDGSVEWVFDTSTGRRGFRTPKGTFEITKEVDEPNVAGAYRPKYFLESDDLSIHGYSSVPTYPFSHGCARVTKAAMNWIWAHGDVPVGTEVWIA